MGFEDFKVLWNKLFKWKWF